jgi:hypothetical protein
VQRRWACGVRVIARVWYSRAGADQGSPWWVQVGDSAPEQCDNFQLVGFARPRFVPGGETSLPEGPRGFIEVEIPPAPVGVFSWFAGWLARRAGWRF